ncbi:MAG: hypothetical protein NTZ26_15530, partial [Candidatus Aminicenantes bacterium]|nr:hypothetical protein [Candidatus Aminicenantes bacterium]
MTRTPSRPTHHPLPLLALAFAFGLSAQTPADGRSPQLVSAKSGQLPNGQVVTPTGLQIDLPDMRPHVLALSPDGKLLVTSGRT